MKIKRLGLKVDDFGEFERIVKTAKYNELEELGRRIITELRILRLKDEIREEKK